MTIFISTVYVTKSGENPSRNFFIKFCNNNLFKVFVVHFVYIPTIRSDENMLKEIKIENLFEEDKKKYLAIIFFTYQFACIRKWFRLCHYRYALQKNHNLSHTYEKSISKIFDEVLNREYELVVDV